MSRYIAIDHGGTKTEMLIFDERGEVVYRADDRKLFKTGERRRLKWHQRLWRLCDQVFKEDGLLGFDETIISLNGINTERDRRIAVRDGKEQLHLARVRVVGDSVAALRGSDLTMPDHAVCVVICAGSGLNVALKMAGHPCQSLGCRISPSDHGGYGIGRRILDASLDAHNEFGKPTMLKQLLQTHFHSRSFSRLLESVSCGQTAFAPEEFAPILFKAAHLGDGVAVEIVDELARRWAGYADLMLRECCKKTVPNVRLYLSGGIFKDKYGVMETAVRKYSGQMVCQPDIQLSRFGPVVGCALLALERRYNGGIPQEVLANLQRTLRGVNRRRYGRE